MLLFVFWPVAAFAYALGRIEMRGARLLIVAFFGLFGYTLITPSNYADTARYKQYFQETAQRPFSDFFGIISGLYSDEGVKPDFVQNLIYFTLSRITQNSKYLFLVIGLLLGITLLINIRKLVAEYAKNKNVYSFLFIVFLFVLIPPFRIVSFRQYLADLIFLFGIYQFFVTREKKYILITISSIFIHFGFFLMLPLLAAFLLVGRRNYVFYLLIVLSFFFNDYVTNLLQNIGLDMGGGFEVRTEGYTSEKYLEKITGLRQQRNIVLDNYIQWTFYFLMASMIFFKLKFKKLENACEYLYSFCLLLFAFLNFSRELSFISDRFGVLLILLCCVFFVRFFVSLPKVQFPLFLVMLIIVILGNFIILFRINLEYANVSLITPFLPITLFYDPELSLLDLIK